MAPQPQPQPQPQPPTFGAADRIIDSRQLVNRVNNDPKSTWTADTYGTNEFNVDQFARSRLGARLELNIGSGSGSGTSMLHAAELDGPEMGRRPIVGLRPAAATVRHKLPAAAPVTGVNSDRTRPVVESSTQMVAISTGGDSTAHRIAY